MRNCQIKLQIPTSEGIGRSMMIQLQKAKLRDQLQKAKLQIQLQKSNRTGLQ
jgi:hypothetical protein